MHKPAMHNTAANLAASEKSALDNGIAVDRVGEGLANLTLGDRSLPGIDDQSGKRTDSLAAMKIEHQILGPCCRVQLAQAAPCNN